MPDSDANRSGSPEPTAPSSSNSERRRNHALRELVDEMLVSIRGAARQEGLWTTEERAQYERELSTIMSRVRTEAIGGEDAGAPKAAGQG